MAFSDDSSSTNDALWGDQSDASGNGDTLSFRSKDGDDEGRVYIIAPLSTGSRCPKGGRPPPLTIVPPGDDALEQATLARVDSCRKGSLMRDDESSTGAPSPAKGATLPAGGTLPTLSRKETDEGTPKRYSLDSSPTGSLLGVRSPNRNTMLQRMTSSGAPTSFGRLSPSSVDTGTLVESSVDSEILKQLATPLNPNNPDGTIILPSITIKAPSRRTFFGSSGSLSPVSLAPSTPTVLEQFRFGDADETLWGWRRGSLTDMEVKGEDTRREPQKSEEGLQGEEWEEPAGEIENQEEVDRTEVGAQGETLQLGVREEEVGREGAVRKVVEEEMGMGVEEAKEERGGEEEEKARDGVVRQEEAERERVEGEMLKEMEGVAGEKEVERKRLDDEKRMAEEEERRREEEERMEREEEERLMEEERRAEERRTEREEEEERAEEERLMEEERRAEEKRMEERRAEEREEVAVERWEIEGDRADYMMKVEKAGIKGIVEQRKTDRMNAWGPVAERCCPARGTFPASTGLTLLNEEIHRCAPLKDYNQPDEDDEYTQSQPSVRSDATLPQFRPSVTRASLDDERVVEPLFLVRYNSDLTVKKATDVSIPGVEEVEEVEEEEEDDDEDEDEEEVKGSEYGTMGKLPSMYSGFFHSRRFSAGSARNASFRRYSEVFMPVDDGLCSWKRNSDLVGLTEDATRIDVLVSSEAAIRGMIHELESAARCALECVMDCFLNEDEGFLSQRYIMEWAESECRTVLSKQAATALADLKTQEEKELAATLVRAQEAALAKIALAESTASLLVWAEASDRKSVEEAECSARAALDKEWQLAEAHQTIREERELNSRVLNELIDAKVQLASWLSHIPEAVHFITLCGVATVLPPAAKGPTQTQCVSTTLPSPVVEEEEEDFR